MGVNPFYTNIPNHEGMEALKETPNKQAKKQIPTQVTIKFLYLILIVKNFVFNGINYRQMKGCAMVTICAYTFTNIIMGKVEKMHIYPYLRVLSTFYCRFMDNIIFLWNGTESEVIKLIDNFNKKHSTKKFELTYSRTSITSLDSKLYKNKNTIPCTIIYRKPSAPGNFLCYKSARPKALKDSKPCS